MSRFYSVAGIGVETNDGAKRLIFDDARLADALACDLDVTSFLSSWLTRGGNMELESKRIFSPTDCTDSAEELCSKFEVKGFPTIKYFVDGDVGEGKDYQGGRASRSPWGFY